MIKPKSVRVNQKRPFDELVLHHFWKNQPMPGMYKSDCGKSVQLLFSGWYNVSDGPDFKNAKIVINSIERYGDVEIHVNERDWFSHSHHTDNAYNKVLLHVFVVPSPKKENLTDDFPIISIQIPKALIMPLTSKSKKELLKNINGACGIAISQKNVTRFKKIISSAAEARLVTKSQAMKTDLEESVADGNEEQFLYEKLFEGMGVPHYKGIFNYIAVAYTYRKFLKDAVVSMFDERTLTETWKTLFMRFYRERYVDLENTDKRQDKKIRHIFTGVYNNPANRFLPMANHLFCTRRQSLLNSWMGVFNALGERFANHQEAGDGHAGRVNVTGSALLSYFHPLFGFSKASGVRRKGIPDNKLIVLLANAAIPFFMAWADIHNDETLRRTLFAMFILLPGEGKNRKIDFMKSRLGISSNNLTMNNTLKEHQGLIQLHDDCCHHFSGGCVNCTLANMLAVPPHHHERGVGP